VTPKRPNLLEVMKQCDHVADGVLEAAQMHSCAILLVQEIEGQRVPFVVREEPAISLNIAMYHYSRDEIEYLAHRFSGRRVN
jgi:hypothetical protein